MSPAKHGRIWASGCPRSARMATKRACAGLLSRNTRSPHGAPTPGLATMLKWYQSDQTTTSWSSTKLLACYIRGGTPSLGRQLWRCDPWTAAHRSTFRPRTRSFSRLACLDLRRYCNEVALGRLLSFKVQRSPWFWTCRAWVQTYTTIQGLECLGIVSGSPTRPRPSSLID